MPGFNEQSARRISKTVRGFERMRRDLTGHRRRSRGGALLDTWEVHGYKFISSTMITIRARLIHFHAIARCEIAEQNVNLTGSPCFVYAKIMRSDYTTATILTSSTAPVSSASVINPQLYRFNFNSETGKYSLSLSGKFDVNVDAPVMT